MAPELTYDPTPADQPEFNEAEQEALAIGEAQAAEENKMLALVSSKMLRHSNRLTSNYKRNLENLEMNLKKAKGNCKGTKRPPKKK